MDLDTQPWFRGPTDSSPFSLFTMLHSRSRAFHCVACFPWTTQSSNVLWDGNMQHGGLESEWRDVANEWMGAIAVGGTGRVCIFPKLATRKPTVVNISDANAEITNVAWAISRKPLKPLLVFTVTSVILIYDVAVREIVGKLRGHGGPITSLSVHPSSPELFCTTSRDFTARIYDLTLPPVQTPNNPPWFPKQGPSLAGPAHGLHMCEPEGEGIGRAVAVMIGGRSGGHAGAVLCSAFHPSHPLIATGGMDRAVKIWRIPPTVFAPPPGPPILAREDKPLFSTDLIHQARVLSIHWLADDILTSCSAPALMRYKPEDAERTYWEAGTGMSIIIVWQWLAFNRFFPVGKVPQKVMRGTASDWRNSESFKVLSGYQVPPAVKRFYVYQSLTHDPLLLIPLGKAIHIFNISRFSVRQPPKFPLDKLSLGGSGSRSSTPGPTVANKQAQNQSFSGLERHDDNTNSSGAAPLVREEEQGGEQEGGRPEGDDGEQHPIFATTYPPPASLAALFDSVESWKVVAELPQGGCPPVMPDITMCAMAFEGMGIVGIGQEGTLYAWRLKTERLGRG